MSVTRKQLLYSIDGTPEKRTFLSIINDYDLKTGICELVDNALDQWQARGRQPGLVIDVVVDVDRQVISVRDNAGGVREDDARRLVAPGATRPQPDPQQIGIFGVGGKRAGVALGEHVEIRSRYEREKSLQIDITGDWIQSEDWEIDLFEIPDIDPGTTTIGITKLRQGLTADDVIALEPHLGETYSWYIGQGCCITFNGSPIKPLHFDIWAYPPKYMPRRATFTIKPDGERELNVSLTAGLIRDRDPDRDNYGVYLYCNRRLIVKELKSRDVGYFVSAEAGVPHPDASLCRVIVELAGDGEVMPWNSSKNGINFGHPSFVQIRRRVIDFASYYSTLSRRLKTVWDDEVFAFKRGRIELVDPEDASSNKRRVLPKLPRARRPPLLEALRANNKELTEDNPWLLGLVEAMGLVEVIQRQRAETKNRTALILLDSNLEIALKEFIVNNPSLYPPYQYTDSVLLTLFARRTNVMKEVLKHVVLSDTMQKKISHYYNLRNKLVHERATVGVADSQVADYEKLVRQILKKLFDVKFP